MNNRMRKCFVFFVVAILSGCGNVVSIDDHRRYKSPGNNNDGDNVTISVKAEKSLKEMQEKLAPCNSASSTNTSSRSRVCP